MTTTTLENNLTINQYNLISITQDLIKQINNECFNGQLQLDQMPISLCDTSRAAAYVSFKCTKVFKVVTHVSITRLRVSKNYQWTMTELKDTLCHELIHIYEAQILKQKPGHQKNFKNKMNEINNNFKHYKITTRHSMTSTKVIKPRVMKLTNVTYLMSEDRTKIIFVSQGLLHKIKNRFDYKIFIKKVFENDVIEGTISASLIKGKYKTNTKLKSYYKVTDPLKMLLGI